jgi:hypothetical protein
VCWEGVAYRLPILPHGHVAFEEAAGWFLRRHEAPSFESDSEKSAEVFSSMITEREILGIAARRKARSKSSHTKLPDIYLANQGVIS